MSKGKVDTRVWDELVEKLSAADKAGSEVRIGILGRGKRSGEGEQADILDVAVYNEFGTSRIPARPFIREGVSANQAKISKFMAGVGRRILTGKLEPEQGLGLIGEFVVKEIRDRIVTGDNYAPNSDYTIAKKKSARPLVDTGQLIAAISYKVGPKTE